MSWLGARGRRDTALLHLHAWRWQAWCNAVGMTAAVALAFYTRLLSLRICACTVAGCIHRFVQRTNRACWHMHCMHAVVLTCLPLSHQTRLETPSLNGAVLCSAKAGGADWHGFRPPSVSLGAGWDTGPRPVTQHPYTISRPSSKPLADCDCV